MTFLQAYVIFGIPLIALSIAGGALWLTGRSARRVDEQRKPSE